MRTRFDRKCTGRSALSVCGLWSRTQTHAHRSPHASIEIQNIKQVSVARLGQGSNVSKRASRVWGTSHGREEVTRQERGYPPPPPSRVPGGNKSVIFSARLSRQRYCYFILGSRAHTKERLATMLTSDLTSQEVLETARTVDEARASSCRASWTLGNRHDSSTQQATTLKGTARPKGDNGTPSLGHTISRPLGLLGRSSNRINASQSSNQGAEKHRRVILFCTHFHNYVHSIAQPREDWTHVCYTIFLRDIHSPIDSHTPYGCLGWAWSV